MVIRAELKLRIMVLRVIMGLVLLLTAVFGATAYAQPMIRPGLPLPTTLTLQKPGPEETFAGKQVIEIGYKQQAYRYILKDAYVDDPAGIIMWNDIWRSVEQFRPNFQLQGPNGDKLAQLKPGETVTVQGMYAPVTRTFEINSISPGPGISAPPKAY